jgi:hypothetical protein
MMDLLFRANAMPAQHDDDEIAIDQCCDSVLILFVTEFDGTH